MGRFCSAILILAVCACTAWGPEPEVGATLTYEVKGATADEFAKVVEILQDRLDDLDIRGLALRKAGEGRFEVDIPTTHSDQPGLIRQLIQTPGKLRFQIVSRDQNQATIERILDLKEKGEYDPAKEDYDIALKPVIPPDPPPAPGKPTSYVLLETHGSMKGGSLTAYPMVDELQRPAIGFKWKGEAVRRFGDLTEQCVGRQLGIVFDGRVKSAPTIMDRIGATGRITGTYTQAEVENLVIILNKGELPSVPTLVGEEIKEKGKEEQKE